MRSAALLLFLLGCLPEPGAPPSLISAPRVLAVRGQPAEVAPGGRAVFSIVVATPAGTLESPRVEWALCLASKPLAENNVVAPSCLMDQVRLLGEPAAQVEATVPEDACARFGPDTPPAEPGQPAQRPRAPDVTGGFYQPVRARLSGLGPDGGDLLAFGLARLTCNLPGAPLSVAREFRERYRNNENPRLLEVVTVDPEGAAQPLQKEVAPGTPLRLRARFDPQTAERYLLYDAIGGALVERREALRLSWFATAGGLAHDRTGRAEDDPQAESDNQWTAPEAPGPVSLWVVLRDSRGGVDFATFTVNVTGSRPAS